MTSVHEIAEEYEAVCREYGSAPNSFIRYAFDKEKQETILRKRMGVLQENMHLRLRGNPDHAKLTDHDIMLICKTLEKCQNTFINRLDLAFNNITDEGATVLAEFLSRDNVIREINLMGNDIEEDGAVALAKVLQDNTSLMSLRINGNKFGNKAGMAFAGMLQVNTAIQELDIGETDQKTESMIAFATVLRENDGLKALCVDSPLLFSHQEETTVHFARMLKVNKTLVELHLQKSKIEDFGATRLAECLMDSMTLRCLDLRCNRITRDGAKELGKLLKNNASLRVLNLGSNRIECDGAASLAEALATCNMTLTCLGITSNNIRDRGLCAIADAMRLNLTLTNLYVWGNIFGNKASTELGQLVESGRIDSSSTDIQPYTVDGQTYLAEVSHGIRKWYYWEPTFGENVPRDDELEGRLVTHGVA